MEGPQLICWVSMSCSSWVIQELCGLPGVVAMMVRVDLLKLQHGEMMCLVNRTLRMQPAEMTK